MHVPLYEINKTLSHTFIQIYTKTLPHTFM